MLYGSLRGLINRYCVYSVAQFMKPTFVEEPPKCRYWFGGVIHIYKSNRGFEVSIPHKQGRIFIWFKVLYQNKYRPILRKWNTYLINAEEVTALGYPMDPSRGQSTQLKPWLICFFTVNSDPRIDISGAMVSIYSFSTWQSIVSASFIHID